MSNLRALFELRDMLRRMEHDVGLDDLSPAEKDVFQAAHNLTEVPGQAIQSDHIRNHNLVEGIAQATYHRALKALLDLGLLERPDGVKAKHYIVRQDLLQE